MSERDDATALKHMRDAASQALRFVAGKRRQDLDEDDMLALAVVKAIEIVGEAAGRVSEEGKENMEAVPWREVIGTRNRLVHGYDTLDYDIVWQIVTRDLPALLPPLQIKIDALDSNEG